MLWIRFGQHLSTTLVFTSVFVAFSHTEPRVKVRMVLNWFPEVEHGGFYAAKVLGLYEAAGVDMQIVGGGPDAPVVAQVATGKMDFGVANADEVVFGRAQKAPVVAVMAPLQTNPQCIMVHEDSGIRRLQDIANVTLAMSSKPAYSHFLRKTLALKGVTIVPYVGNVSRFLVEKNFAQQGYLFSEPFVAMKEGAKPRAILIAESGFNPYASCLLATEARIAQDPELIAKIVDASVRGWEAYLQDPLKTNEYIHKLNPQMSMEILQYGVEEMQPLVLGDLGEQRLGAMKNSRWQTLVQQMEKVELVEKGSVVPDQAFTLAFLPKPNKNEEPAPED